MTSSRAAIGWGSASNVVSGSGRSGTLAPAWMLTLPSGECLPFSRGGWLGYNGGDPKYFKLIIYYSTHTHTLTHHTLTYAHTYVLWIFKLGSAVCGCVQQHFWQFSSERRTLKDIHRSCNPESKNRRTEKLTCEPLFALLVIEHNTADMKGFSLMFSPGRIKRVLCLSKVKNIGCNVSLCFHLNLTI